MRKNNKNGFMLAELLIVTVSIMAIFTIIYANYIPTIGEYEKRLEYNNVNSVYSAFYFRTLYLKMFNENQNVESDFIANFNNEYVTLVSNGICENNFSSVAGFQDNCNDLVTNLGIEEAIFTNFNMNNLNDYSGVFSDYIKYFSINNSDEEVYRLLIKTKDGYSTTPFYSKPCQSYIYGEWENWGVTPCNESNSDVCESETIYVNIGEWTTTPCDTNNPLCETREQGAFGEWGDYSTIECVENATTQCDGPTSGYIIEKRSRTGTSSCAAYSCNYTATQTNGTTCLAANYAVYCKPTYNSPAACTAACGGKICSGTIESWYCSSAIPTIMYQSSCPSDMVNSTASSTCPGGYEKRNNNGNYYCYKCTSYNKVYTCPNGGTVSGTTCVKNCYRTCATFGATTTTYGKECEDETVGGTYYNNTEWTTKCTETNYLYRSKTMNNIHTEYRLNTIRDNPTEVCMSTEEEPCQSIKGYRTRSDIENIDDLNNFSVTSCEVDS